MITITDETNKVFINSTTSQFMTSIVYKQQLNRISYNADADILVIYSSNDRLLISYIYIDPAQRQELGINNNLDLLNYFNSIT